MIETYTDLEIKITKQICLETLEHNLEFKKSKPDMNPLTGESWIDGFRWQCYDSMLNRNKRIHLRRTRRLIKNGLVIENAHKIHDFFVSQRIMEGWILEAQRMDRDKKTGEWLGHDPMMKSLKDCLPGQYDYCIRRNHIAYYCVQEGLKLLS